MLKHIGLEPATFDVHAAAYQTQLVSSFVRRSLFKFERREILARAGAPEISVRPAARAGRGRRGTGRCTVRVHLADAFAPFVHNLAEPWTAILPPEVEDRQGEFKSAESLIGCGPFMLGALQARCESGLLPQPEDPSRG